MKYADKLISKGITAPILATKLGVTRQYGYKILKKNPSDVMKAKIMQEYKFIKPADFF